MKLYRVYLMTCLGALQILIGYLALRLIGVGVASDEAQRHRIVGGAFDGSARIVKEAGIKAE